MDPYDCDNPRPWADIGVSQIWVGGESCFSASSACSTPADSSSAGGLSRRSRWWDIRWRMFKGLFFGLSVSLLMMSEADMMKGLMEVLGRKERKGNREFWVYRRSRMVRTPVQDMKEDIQDEWCWSHEWLTVEGNRESIIHEEGKGKICMSHWSFISYL